jgi:hypothetical protein
LNFATFKNEKIKKERIERYEKINVDSSWLGLPNIIKAMEGSNWEEIVDWKGRRS